MSSPADAVPPGRTAVPRETDEHRYMRQTRNAVVTLAVIAVLGVIASLIVGIVIAVGIAHQNSTLNGGSSACVSQGGTVPYC